jgi:signal transduction histidine kinase
MVMIDPKNKLFAPDNGWNFLAAPEKQRMEILSELGLLQPETIPVFEEATQTAAHFLGIEISILGFMDEEIHRFKASVGLSRLGLMNDLAKKRQLLRRDAFCSQVVENSQILVINDTLRIDSQMSNNQLVKKYGIRSYLGVPLMDAAGNCLGALAVMARQPRNFTEQDVAFLQLIARWSMSEFERNRILQRTPKNSRSFSAPNQSIASLSSIAEEDTEEQEIDWKIAPPVLEVFSNSTERLKLDLLDKLTQELRTPLTSILGMTGVLEREIYGPLTSKQKEYLEIIQHSGKYLLSLVNEINELGTLDDRSNALNISSVNIEMLCQQAIQTLSEVATRRDQDIRLSIEPGHNSILSLDKEKVRQIIYHLLFSMVQVSPTGSIINIHVSFKDDWIKILIWVSHPWLGDGIAEINPNLPLDVFSMLGSELRKDENIYPENLDQHIKVGQGSDSAESLMDSSGHDLSYDSANLSREKLGLLLSCQLAELHGGEISMQGSPETGYRYLVSLPLQSAK